MGSLILERLRFMLKNITITYRSPRFRLDTWLIHKPTALLFQQYRDQLSLLIHGNNHIAQELARPYEDEGLNGDLQQALRRIDEFERRSGVESFQGDGSSPRSMQ